MRPIHKISEPASLSAYRQTPLATFDGMPSQAKQDLKTQLLSEQGHLCAYCMSRIEPLKMKVAHWHSQKYSDEQLAYANLLACCKGGEGNPPPGQYCDTRQGDRDLMYNPATPAHHGRMKIRYLGNGTIRSDDADFDGQLNEVLNLNLPKLVRNRRAVVDAVRQKLSSLPGTRKKAELTKLVRKWESPDSQSRLNPYCEVALHILRRHQNCP